MLQRTSKCYEAIQPKFLNLLNGSLYDACAVPPTAPRRQDRAADRRPQDWPHCALQAHPIEAISVVDTTAPGSPLIYVNVAWEALTGFTSDGATGFDCSKASDRGGALLPMAGDPHCPIDLPCVTNYRKDGTRFRNYSLHPLCDDDGRMRYMIGVASNADAEAGTAEDVIQLNAWELLPTTFPHTSTNETLPTALPRSLLPEPQLHWQRTPVQ